MENNKQITKRILKIAFPMAAARLINMLSVFIGMIMIAQLGYDVLAASALMSAAYFTVMVIFMFVLFSVGVIVGRHYGAKAYEQIGAVMQQAFVLAFLLAIAMGVLYWFLDRILAHFGQDPALIPYLSQFFHAIAWIAPPLLWGVCLSQFMVAITKMMNVLYAHVISIIVFVLAAYAMIFGHWGSPKLGVAGFAYAILIQDMTILLVLLGCYMTQKKLHIYGLFRYRCQWDWDIFKKLWHVGWPMSMQFGGELIGFFAITILVGLIGVDELAAWQVVQQMMMIFVVPIFSFAEAAAISVGHSMGAKAYTEINKVNTLNLLIALPFVIFGMLVFLFLPKHLASIYMSNQINGYQAELQPMISMLFFISAFIYLCDSYRNLLSGSLRGLYDTRYPMIIGTIVVWVFGVGVGYLLAFLTPLGVYGFSTAQAVAFFVGALLMYFRWRWQLRCLD